MRRLSATRAYIVMLCCNVAAYAGWALDLHYLETHRPAVADPAHGFVLRQDTRHPDGAFYESARDRTVYWALVGAVIVVFAVSGGIAYLYARARERRPTDV